MNEREGEREGGGGERWKNGENLLDDKLVTNLGERGWNHR